MRVRTSGKAPRQSNKVASRCCIWSAIQSASAWMVEVRFTPPERFYDENDRMMGMSRRCR
jgi:hypothetical protein